MSTGQNHNITITRKRDPFTGRFVSNRTETSSAIQPKTITDSELLSVLANSPWETNQNAGR